MPQDSSPPLDVYVFRQTQHVVTVCCQGGGGVTAQSTSSCRVNRRFSTDSWCHLHDAEENRVCLPGRKGCTRSIHVLRSPCPVCGEFPLSGFTCFDTFGVTHTTLRRIVCSCKGGHKCTCWGQKCTCSIHVLRNAPVQSSS